MRGGSKAATLTKSLASHGVNGRKTSGRATVTSTSFTVSGIVGVETTFPRVHRFQIHTRPRVAPSEEVITSQDLKAREVPTRPEDRVEMATKLLKTARLPLPLCQS
jgi:hypothetical protein